MSSEKKKTTKRTNNQDILHVLTYGQTGIWMHSHERIHIRMHARTYTYTMKKVFTNEKYIKKSKSISSQFLIFLMSGRSDFGTICL